jgi:hypothetical protein
LQRWHAIGIGLDQIVCLKCIYHNHSTQASLSSSPRRTSLTQA